MSDAASASTQKAQPPGKAPIPKPVSPASAGKAVECRYCHQWETAVDDGYCGFCGHLLLALEVQPESLILISTLAPQKDLTFRNAGPQPLQAVIVPRTGSKFPALVFDPPGTFTIPSNKDVRVRVGLDAEKLPADLQERELDYVCLVNNDLRKQFPLKITVRSGPRPKVLSPILQFGEIQEGKAVDRSLEISNIGGIPLNVREVLPEGSSHLRLKGPFSSSLIQPGKKLAIPVLWDSQGEDKEGDSGPAGIRIKFGNYPESLFVPARARTFRYLLELKPSAIQLPQVLVKQHYPVKVELENRGTTDLEISGIDSDQPWLKVISQARNFTLLCAESAKQRPGELSPTLFAKRYSFTVVCDPQMLPAGKHQGRITVRPIGQEPKSLGVEITVLHPEPYPDYVGIDFGTTNSVVALFNQETYEIELVEDSMQGSPPSPLIPSILVFEDAETYLIGQAARNAVNTAPDRSVRSIKRIMGYNHEREFFGRKYSPEDLATRIIRKLVELAERKLQNDSDSYFDVRKAIITVPANFYDLQIRGVLEACKAAGLDTEEEKVRLAAQAMQETLSEGVNAGVILDEPSAAVLYYIYRLNQTSEVMQGIDRKEGLRLLVFDYGGGTLDVSVANVIRLGSGEGGLRILANMGDNTIGGDSIDLSLMRELLKRCKEQLPSFDFDTSLINLNFKDVETRRQRESWSTEVWQKVLQARYAWKDLSEAVKIQLSEQERAEVEILPDLILRVADGKIQIAPRSVKLTAIPRALLEDCMQTILDKCKRLVDSALDLAKLNHDQIDYILHTGRQSLLPLIRERVRELFPALPPERDILEPEHVKLCVAKGAALYGWMRDKLGDPQARIHFLSEGRRLPHSYGVEKFSHLMQPEFDEVIPRGAPYPCSKENVYPPEMIPSSGYLNLKFYQNAGRNKRIVKNPEIRQIGQISINTLADDDPGCVVRFVIDANRKLEVFADGHEVTIQPVRLQGEESWMG